MPPTAKPDPTSKAVATGAYAILLAVMIWVGSTVNQNALALARVQTNQRHILSQQESLNRRVSVLERGRNTEKENR